MTLKPTKLSDYGLVVWTSLFCLIGFFLVTRAGPNVSLSQTLSLTISMAVGFALVIPCIVVVVERQRFREFEWKIDSNSVVYQRKGLIKTLKEIKLQDLSSIKFDTLNFKLERGIMMRDKSGVCIFVPQQTDRFFEAQVLLKSNVPSNLQVNAKS